MACNRLVAACGFSFPDQGSNPWCLHWKCGVLATGPQGKYQDVLILVLLPHYLHPAAKGIHFKRQLDCITPLIKTSKLIIIRKYPQPPPRHPEIITLAQEKAHRLASHPTTVALPAQPGLTLPQTLVSWCLGALTLGDASHNS